MNDKLIFRNVQRMARDYLIYFFTMVLVTALMFSFNSILFSEDVQNVADSIATMTILMQFATVFVVLIVAWLINYMVHFILLKRNREFGIYLLIGMKQKEISWLYMKENVVLGAGAFLIGIGVGLFLQQILMAVLYTMIQMTYRVRVSFDWRCLLMTAICYGGCYLLALIRCRRQFKKMNIHDLLEAQKRNEEVRESHESIKQWFLLAGSLIFLMLGYCLYGNVEWNTGTLLVFLFSLVAAIYILYTGLAAKAICYTRKHGTLIYKGQNLFLLKQFASKVKSMRFTMGTITSLFVLALLGGSVAMMFNDFQTQVLLQKFPFDVQVHSSNPYDDFEEETALIDRETESTDTFHYQILQNGSNQINTWMYTHLSVFGDDFRLGNGEPDAKKIDEYGGSEYCRYDTYLRLSDYNRLREMLNLEKVSLEEDQYLIHMKARVLNETGNFSDSLQIEGKNGKLRFAGYYTEPFSQDGHNGGDYIIVIPDSQAVDMQPYYSELVAAIKGNPPKKLSDELDEIIDIKDEKEFDETEGNSCYGSDTILVYYGENLVSSVIIPELKCMLSSIVFPLMYIGLVFVCIATTVLAVQQVSDSVKYRFRYGILHKMGMNISEIKRLIGKELFFYYLCPAFIAVLLSGLIALYAGGNFNYYTGVHTPAGRYFGISVGLFGMIYMIYFMITYICFMRNVESEFECR